MPFDLSWLFLLFVDVVVLDSCSFLPPGLPHLLFPSIMGCMLLKLSSLEVSLFGRMLWSQVLKELTPLSLHCCVPLGQGMPFLTLVLTFCWQLVVLALIALPTGPTVLKLVR